MTTPLEDDMACFLRELSAGVRRHDFDKRWLEVLDRLVQEYDSQKARETQSKL